MSFLKLPIEFEYEGIYFKGHFSDVSGAGSSSMFHLTINGLYYGQFWKTAQGDWKFSSNDRMFEEQYMVDFFTNVVESFLKEDQNNRTNTNSNQ
jgi:hypothetical protein